MLLKPGVHVLSVFDYLNDETRAKGTLLGLCHDFMLDCFYYKTDFKHADRDDLCKFSKEAQE